MSSNTSSKQVVVLCAQWCGVCREFKDQFEQLGASTKDWDFAWVDIEEHPDTENVDLETLPTLIVTGNANRVTFLGPVVPKASAIELLLRGLQSDRAIDLSSIDAEWADAVVTSLRTTND